MEGKDDGTSRDPREFVQYIEAGIPSLGQDLSVNRRNQKQNQSFPARNGTVSYVPELVSDLLTHARVSQIQTPKIKMINYQKVVILPWKTGLVANEQVETYRQAIAPLQANLAATKAARQRAFKWMKGGNNRIRVQLAAQN